MVPARFVAESLDCVVDWNESTKQSVLQLFVSTRRAPLIFVIPIVLVELRWRKLKKELSFFEEFQRETQSHEE